MSIRQNKLYALITRSLIVFAAFSLTACMAERRHSVDKDDWYTQTVNVEYGADILEYEMLCAPAYRGKTHQDWTGSSGQTPLSGFLYHAAFPQWALFNVEDGYLFVEIHCRQDNDVGLTKNGSAGPINRFKPDSAIKTEHQQLTASKMFLFKDLNDENEIPEFIFTFKTSSQQREIMLPIPMAFGDAFYDIPRDVRREQRDKNRVSSQLREEAASKAAVDDFLLSYEEKAPVSKDKKQVELERAASDTRELYRRWRKLSNGVRQYLPAPGFSFDLYQHEYNDRKHYDDIHAAFCELPQSRQSDDYLCRKY